MKMGRAPITHRCGGTVSPTGGYCANEDRVDCLAFRRADGTIENNIECGEPCSWIMGKSGHGTPPWEPNDDGTRRDPGRPDPGFGGAAP